MATKDPGQDQELGEIDRQSIHDDVWGDMTGNGPNYRSVGWMGTTILMVKTQIGLGVLSIPEAFNRLGLIPGIVTLLAIAIITTWSDYMVGVFKLNHPSVYGLDDVGKKLFGRAGQFSMAIAFVSYWIFVAGSGMLGISIALNSVSSHAMCTAGFVAIAGVVCCAAGSIQTLGKISWLAYVGAGCILASILTLTISVATQDRPAAAPAGIFVSDFKLFRSPTFTEAISSISSIVFAYAGTPAFFAIVSEMEDPRKYTRSLGVCQSIVTITYVVIGVVVYHFCGSYVSSPALGSAGEKMKRVCYALALPGLIVTTLLCIHLCAKYCFVRLLQGSRHLSQNTLKHNIVWYGSTITVAVIAYIIASAIPSFGPLVSLIGASLGTLMSFQPMGAMWLYDNWHLGKIHQTPTWGFMVCWSVFVIVVGFFLMGGGTYGAVVGIIEAYGKLNGTAAWTCADNSLSAKLGH